MPKGKPKTQTVINQNTIIKGLDYDLLADAIVKAQEKAEDIRLEDEKNLADAQWEQWQSILGIKRPQDNWSTIRKSANKVRNRIVSFWKLLWLRRDNTYKEIATISLMKTAISLLMGMLKCVSYVVAIVAILGAMYYHSNQSFYNPICLVIIGIASFVIGRMIRIAQFEIEKIKDEQYLIGILSIILSVIALVVSFGAWFYPR